MNCDRWGGEASCSVSHERYPGLRVRSDCDQDGRPCDQAAMRLHACMTVALTLRSRLSMVVVLCSFSANLTMVLQVSREFFIRSAVFKLDLHDPLSLCVLYRLESQVKKVMTNWEIETAVSSHHLNHALRFRHVHVRQANILRTRTVRHFPIFCFLKLTAAEWRLFICSDDTDLKLIEVCASQGQGAMTRLAGKIAQAVQTRNDYAMRRLGMVVATPVQSLSVSQESWLWNSVTWCLLPSNKNAWSHAHGRRARS